MAPDDLNRSSPAISPAAVAASLAAAGLAVDPDGLARLVAGVAAAPGGEDAWAWLPLLARLAGWIDLPPLPGDVRRSLRDWLDAERARDCGLADASPRAGRLDALRAELRTQGLDGFLVPLADEHNGEYIPPAAQRLAWLTGFTGSAGMAVVLGRRAALFVDGRYTLQARAQVDGALYEFQHLIENPPAGWIATAVEKGERLGFDPWLHSPAAVEAFRTACAKTGAELVAVDRNPVDVVWTARPPAPLGIVSAHPFDFTGRTAADKIAEIGRAMAEKGAAATVLSAPDSIAWLLNVRGADVPHTPLPLSFAIVTRDIVTRDQAPVAWFVDRRKLAPGLESHLGPEISIHPPDAFGSALDALGQGGRPVLLDKAGTNDWIWRRLADAKAKIVAGNDPCQLPKARKNGVELAGMRAAHRRDGAALVRFLAWLARTAPAGTVDEIMAAARLADFRRAGERFCDFSFTTSSGAGPNGAIVHYRVTDTSNRRLAPGEIYLVDSGAQYLDGTTDVTRTVFIGGGAAPTPEMRDRFTRVLRGHIALARARFPAGTSGEHLDALARVALWEAGLDYDHGTGHGVGSFLSVHEGPQRVAKRGSAVPLEPGMIVSNEPGYYKAGAYGIRIENLVVVREGAAGEGGRAMLEFETLTLAPIERALIEPTLLSAAERAWLDAYHARVRAEIGPLVDAETAAWLDAATAPIGD
ncbi:MAG: aminopeptidase P family protein [Alphaproteobacteria bacterium]